jgi:hypothetical protein
MHSFHQSRGRILFEVLCAFGISACCVWAWMQTYATAMLGPAVIAGLYGLVRFFDMFRRVPVVQEAAAAEPVIRAVDLQAIASEATAAPEAKHELPAEVVAALVRKPKRKTKRPAKVEPAVDEPGASEAEAVGPEAEPQYSAPIAPLFEPEPFVRLQQRAAFGRKFGAR